MRKILKENRGFSLVELLIALLIMAVIAGTAITLFGGVLNTSKSGADRETADAIKRAILTYMNASNDVDLSCLDKDEGGAAATFNSAELIAALAGVVTIDTTVSPATGSVKPDGVAAYSTKYNTGDLNGSYGPFLEKVVVPAHPDYLSWKIVVSKSKMTISVEASKSATSEVDIQP